jgi:hypothetical protein
MAKRNWLCLFFPELPEVPLFLIEQTPASLSASFCSRLILKYRRTQSEWLNPEGKWRNGHGYKELQLRQRI